ncbi:unnamed protein product [Ixodes persulcatus]
MPSDTALATCGRSSKCDASTQAATQRCLRVRIRCLSSGPSWALLTLSRTSRNRATPTFSSSIN